MARNHEPPTTNDQRVCLLASAALVCALALTSSAQTGPAGMRDPAWSPDGKRLAVVSLDHIWTILPDGKDPHELTKLAGSEREPAWSPDGSRIAFRWESGSQTSIAVVNADAPDADPVTLFDRINVSVSDPTWSPDGSLLAFNAYGSIYVVGRDGTDVRRIVTTGARDDRTAPAWAPDGSRIVYWGVGDDGREELRSVALDGSDARPFGTQPDEDNAIAVAWSPDGRWLTFGSVAGGTGTDLPDRLNAERTAASYPSRVWLTSVDGSERFLLAALGSVPRWRPTPG